MTDLPDEDTDRATALNGIMRQIRAGEITARDADTAFGAAGVLPYPKALPGGVSALAWSLPLALAWIATRRLDLMEAITLKAQFWGESVTREPAEAGWATDLATARGHLEAALMWGEVAALGRRADEDAAREVPAAEWAGLAAGFAEGSVALDRGLRDQAPARWHEIRLRPADVMRLWPAVPGEASAPVEVLSPPRVPRSEAGTTPAELPPQPADEAPRAVAPTSRAGRRNAKAPAIERAKVLMEDAPGGMLLPDLRIYIKQREPLLSRKDIDDIKFLYRDLRHPGDHAKTRAKTLTARKRAEAKAPE